MWGNGSFYKKYSKANIIIIILSGFQDTNTGMRQAEHLLLVDKDFLELSRLRLRT